VYAELIVRELPALHGQPGVDAGLHEQALCTDKFPDNSLFTDARSALR
jgi:hypothetical protein